MGGLFNRGSQNRPFPCISKFATNAFQRGTDPQPLQVWRFTPARPKAGGIKLAPETFVAVIGPSVICWGWKVLPSRSNSASNFPGPRGAQNFSDGGLIGAQKVREYAEIGSERNNGAHVEIPVRPPVQSVADAASAGVGLNQAGAGGRQYIVDRGMTQGTLNPGAFRRS